MPYSAPQLPVHASPQQRIAALAQALYAAHAPALLAAIEDLIQRYRNQIASSPLEDSTDERDIVLITYGDTLYAEGERPLQTLHRFAKIYLRDFIKTIHILPFYPYSSDDGFSVQDYYAVNPQVGTWDDVTALSQDFGLMFDAVFNHMSAESKWFRYFLERKPGYDRLFMTATPESDLSAVTRPRQSPLLTPFQTVDGETIHVWTTFSADQVDFDIRDPGTLLRLLDVLLFYISKGATMIRLDAIAFLWKEAGTSSIHLPQTHGIIQLMRAVLDAIAPQVILITETNVPHAENVSYFGDGSNEAQMVYNFTLPPLLVYTFLQRDATKLRDWVNSLKTPSDKTTFFNFTASHDGVGLRPVEGILDDHELNLLASHAKSSGGRISYRRRQDGADVPYELNITYVDAIIDPNDDDHLHAKRFVLSQAIAISLAGVPAIYIHSLLGSHNDIEGMQASGHNRRINRAKLALEDIQDALADQEHFRAQVFTALSHLLSLRREQSAFHPNASQTAIDINRHDVFALLRRSETQTLLALFNLSAHDVPIDLSEHVDGVMHDLITGQSVVPHLTMGPYQVLWLNLP